MKRIINIWSLIFVLAALLPFGLFSQDKVLVRGTILDTENFALAQVSVTEVNKDNRIMASTLSDLDGNFSLNMTNVNNKLVFKYLGSATQEIVVGDKRMLNIVMADGENMLAGFEIVARPKRNVGMLDIEERDISMAVGRVNADDLAELNAASIDDALQGRISGVDIVGTTGDPGGGMSIRIRGTTSINGNNQPLIVVDGVPLETTIGTDFDFGTATEEEYSQLLNVPPSDIKEIVVLKDAGATAIWGARAANGVLQITTKRGVVSAPKISLRSVFAINNQPAATPMLSGPEYSTMILEAMANAGIVYNPITRPEFAYDPKNPEVFYNYSNDTDWIGALTQTGWSQEYNLSLSGGSSKIRYRVSAGFRDETATTINRGLNRVDTRMNLDYYVSDKLRFQADIAYSHAEVERNFVPTSDNSSADIRGHAYVKMPIQSIYYYNERGEETDVFFTPESNIQGKYPNVYNPVALAQEGKNNSTNEKIIPKFNIQYVQNSAIRYNLNVSFDLSNNKISRFLPLSATGLPWNNFMVNSASDKDEENFVMQVTGSAMFNPQFKDPDKHRLTALAGFNTYDNKYNGYYASSGNLASTELQDPSIPSRVTPEGVISSGSAQQRLMGVYGDVSYTLLDRYIIHGSLRMDGNSRFGSEYQYGVFPSASARYRISGEPIFKKFKWLDDLSIRGSWGLSGKTPDKNYLFYSKYSSYNYNYLGQSAVKPISTELKNLRWEKISMKNVGGNLILFNNLINADFDFYSKRTDDMLQTLPVPSSSGFSNLLMNSGILESTGWELNVMSNLFKNKNWNVSFNFNVARNETKLLEISNYATTEFGTWSSNGSYLSRREVGQPYGGFYGYKYAGVYLNDDQTIARDQSGNKIYAVDANGNSLPVYMKFGYPSIDYRFQAGDAKYEDINKDGNINYQDIVYLGDYNPLFNGGFGPNVRYKNVSLSAYFVYRYGNKIINQARMNMENMNGFDNQSKSTLRRFQNSYDNPEDAPSDLLPRALHRTGYNYLASDRFVEDGSFVRWKSITFKYKFPIAKLKRLYLSELELWCTVSNLYTWTNYTGQDPEVAISGSKPGYDMNRTPRGRDVSLGFTLSF